MTAAAIPGVMSPDYAVGEQVSFNDPEIVGDQVIDPMATARCATDRVRPAALAAAAVAVMPKNRGLNTPVSRMWPGD